MQAFSTSSRVVDNREEFTLHLREESLARNLVATVADKLCALTGHNLERTRLGSRALNYLLWLPATTAKELAAIPVDTATARALDPEPEWFDERHETTAELIAEGFYARNSSVEDADAAAKGVV